MNMLNLEMRALAAFSKEEQKTFGREFNNDNIEVLSNIGRWVPAVINLELNDILRLKLKKSFYTMVLLENGEQVKTILENPFIKNNSICAEREYFTDGSQHEDQHMICGVEELIYFVPSTQAEIDSVQPKLICDEAKIALESGVEYKLECDSIKEFDELSELIKQYQYTLYIHLLYNTDSKTKQHYREKQLPELCLRTGEVIQPNPKFKRGDLMKNKNGTSICRLEFSIMAYKAEMSFNEDAGTYADLTEQTKPTKEETKNYEHQEMLHGKKYNEEKEDYDEFLTADGLIGKDFLQLPHTDIEFFSEAYGEWHQTNHNIESLMKIVKDCHCDSLSSYRRKPQETFVDVEIDWKGLSAFIDNSDGDRLRVNTLAIYHTLTIGMLIGYKYSDDKIVNRPVIPNKDKTGIKEKATHARFIKPPVL